MTTRASAPSDGRRWRLTYPVGEYGLDDGGPLMVPWRFATDWGKPQFEGSSAPDYATATTDGSASLRARFDMKTGLRPWRKGTVVDVHDDGLRPGEQTKRAPAQHPLDHL